LRLQSYYMKIENALVLATPLPHVVMACGAHVRPLSD
jgi:hypothetical protein